jgi:hypothetical protein
LQGFFEKKFEIFQKNFVFAKISKKYMKKEEKTLDK